MRFEVRGGVVAVSPFGSGGASLYGGEPEGLPGCEIDLPRSRVRECDRIVFGALLSWEFVCWIGGGCIQSHTSPELGSV